MIVFYILAAVMVACAVYAVTSRRMMRSATALFFVLVGTAGFYLLLNYHFLAAVQLAVYAGGVMVLFLFAIMLTSAQQQSAERHSLKRIIPGALTALAGLAVVAFAFLKHKFVYANPEKITGDYQIPMKEIGHALMGTGRFQYLLPFEVLSVMLLACIIGGILIARKR